MCINFEVIISKVIFWSLC